MSGHRKYPPHWRELVAKVRVRSGGRCECQGECGLHKTHPGPRRCVEVNGKKAAFARGKIVLTTAHLCHDSECDDLDHLRHMCQRCHIRIDIEQHQRNARKTREAKKGPMLFPELAMVLFALLLSGCETVGYLRERDQPAVIPCNGSNCGKEAQWSLDVIPPPASFFFHDQRMNMDALMFVISGMRQMGSGRALLGVWDGWLVTATWNIQSSPNKYRYEFKYDPPMGVRAYMAAVPFLAKSFDVVFYPIVGYHTEEKQRILLKEIVPTLKFSGILIFDGEALEEWQKFMHEMGFIRLPFKFEKWVMYERVNLNSHKKSA